MNKEQKIKKLTRKNFIDNTLVDIYFILILVCFFIVVPYVIGYVIEFGDEDFCNGECNIIDTWVQGFLYFMLCLLGAYIVFYILIEWLGKNYYSAEKHAREEVEGK